MLPRSLAETVTKSLHELITKKNLVREYSFRGPHSFNKLTNKQKAIGGSVLGITAYIYNLYTKSDHDKIISSVPGPGERLALIANTKNESKLRENFNFIDKVVKRCADAVVYIEIRDPRRIDPATGESMIISNGSGFIIREDGWLVTNAHVVISKPQAVVLARLSDGTNYKCSVEDADMNIDIALLKIDCDRKLPVLKLGDSSKCNVGEWVVALGSPLSLSHSVTAGVISSINREAEELGLRNQSMKYIQTDAAITFGNSGGPLVNLDGDVIGINNLRITAGISFAIPIDYAKKFVHRSVMSSGVRPREKPVKQLGITTISISEDVLKDLLYRYKSIPDNVNQGIFVWKVMDNTVAKRLICLDSNRPVLSSISRSGIQTGDIITHINGIPVSKASDIYKFMKEDEKYLLKMNIMRNGKAYEILVINK